MRGDRISAQVTRPGTISSNRVARRARSVVAWVAGRAVDESADRSSGDAGGKSTGGADAMAGVAAAPSGTASGISGSGTSLARTRVGVATTSAVVSPGGAAATGSGTLGDGGQPLLVLRQAT